MEKGKGLILGVVGRARSGKNTFADYLVEIFDKRHQRHFQQTAFATQLKLMCKEYFGLSNEQLWGEKKEIQDERFIKPPPKAIASSAAAAQYWTPREIMQELGGFYRRIDHDFWVKSLERHLHDMRIEDAIVTDVRHINECEYVKNNQGILIKVIRENADEIHGMQHESETALDDKPSNYFDLTVVNNWGLKELKVAAEESSDMIINLENLIKKGRIV